MQRGGFDLLPNLIPPAQRFELLAEALDCWEHAQETCMLHSDGEEIRGGEPARRFLTAAGGANQTALYRSAEVAATLSKTAGVQVVPTGAGGTFTYYARPGDFLTIHRDIVTCDLAVITCLHDAAESGSGGKLCFYPDRLTERLSVIRAAPLRGARTLRLETGHNVILFGGVVPHCVLPVAAGQVRIVSVLCYRMANELE